MDVFGVTRVLKGAAKRSTDERRSESPPEFGGRPARKRRARMLEHPKVNSIEAVRNDPDKGRRGRRFA